MLISSERSTERKVTRMTTRSTTTTTLTEQVATDNNKTKPLSKFEIAVAKIMEKGWTEEEAIAGIDFLKDMTAKARIGVRSCDIEGTHHLTSQEMAMTGYPVMDSIMGHNQIAAEGSAHAAVQVLILSGEEFALTHDNPTGERQDCFVKLHVRYAS